MGKGAGGRGGGGGHSGTHAPSYTPCCVSLIHRNDLKPPGNSGTDELLLPDEDVGSECGGLLKGHTDGSRGGKGLAEMKTKAAIRGEFPGGLGMSSISQELALGTSYRKKPYVTRRATSQWLLQREGVAGLIVFGHEHTWSILG